MYPPLSRSASLTASSLSVFILADAIALVLAGLDNHQDLLDISSMVSYRVGTKFLNFIIR
jgi:hypothetical protein